MQLSKLAKAGSDRNFAVTSWESWRPGPKLANAAAQAGRALVSPDSSPRPKREPSTTCTTPGADAPSFELGDDEIELGLGIHGEAGIEQVHVGRIAQGADRLQGRRSDQRVVVGGQGAHRVDAVPEQDGHDSHDAHDDPSALDGTTTAIPGARATRRGRDITGAAS